MPRFRTPRPDDYSPREVAKLQLLRLQKTAIYERIKRGEIHTVKNEFGETRITKEEIERLQHLWHIKAPKQSLSAETRATLSYLDHSLGGRTKAARHSKEEIAAPLREGFDEWLRREVDPDGLLSAEELSRRKEAFRLAHLTKIRRNSVLRRAATDPRAS